MAFKNLIKKFVSIFSSICDFLQHRWIALKNCIKGGAKHFVNLAFIKKIIAVNEVIQVKVFKKGSLKNHILVKYLLKDLFLYFLVAFLFFFMIFFVNQILLTVEDLLAKSAPFKDVMRIMWYSLPFIIAQSAPFATLVGFLMSLGGMMSSNEILIFRASGFSFFKILIPVATLGLFISIGSFFVNDYLLPLGTMKYNRLMREIMHSTPSIELESNSVKKLDSTHLVIGQVDGNSVSDIILFDSKEKEDRIIIAGQSVLTGAKEEGVLMQLDMNDALVLSFNKSKRSDYDAMNSKKTILNVFDSTFMGTTSRSAREMTSYDVSKVIAGMKETVKTDPTQKRRLNLWLMEFYKKFSLPFGSIFFAFLAFSIAFLFGKHNGQTLGLFLGLVICVLYWAMQIMGQLFVQRVGLNAFWCIWVPNFVIGIFGLIFFIHLLRK